MVDEQLPLFTQPPEPEARPSPDSVRLTPHSPLRAAIAAFPEHMRRADMTENTAKSFLWDLSLLERYLGHEIEVGAIGSRELRDFMGYLRHGRGVRCTPKSYGRRLTTLKVFFSWLAGTGILSTDPAAALVHEPAPSPLPVILSDAQAERALDAARALAVDAENPDPRPLLLLSLILQTGMKKAEALALELAHFDPEAPAVFIRYRNPKRLHKERKLALDQSFPGLLRRYVEAYRPGKVLFPCTGRNLEYVLHRVAQLAGLEAGLSFEMLRWTCAVREFRAGTDSDRLRHKLGLSEIAWDETLPRIQALAAEPL